MKVNKFSLPLISFIVSSISLLLAYYFEVTFDLIPCDLCSKQRLIHFLIFFISIITFLFMKLNFNFRFICKLIILLWISSMVISIYHFGIEKNFWLGFTECSAKLSFDSDTLKNLLSQNPIRCQEVQFKILNISLAGWNAFISFSVFIILVYMLFVLKKDEYEN